MLDHSSFWDIKFDEFYGNNIKLISNNAFGQAAKTVKLMTINDFYGNDSVNVNHSPSSYDVWKVLSSLVNVENICSSKYH